jgi:hypothetical protein
LFQVGGVIELMPENVIGCPGANLFVHPSGHVELRSTFDSLRRCFDCVLQLFDSSFLDAVVSQAFSPLGVMCPQSSTQHVALAQVCVCLPMQCRIFVIRKTFNWLQFLLIPGRCSRRKANKSKGRIRLCYDSGGLSLVIALLSRPLLFCIKSFPTFTISLFLGWMPMATNVCGALTLTRP